jgi:hypothetical protein
VKQEERVFRFKVECFLHGHSGLFRLRILVKRPGQSIPRVDVVPNLKLFAR